MAVELLAADGTAEEETGRRRGTSSSTVKDSIGPETACASEMIYERKRKFPALRTGRGFGSNVIASRSNGHTGLRPGLYQLLVSEEVVDAHLHVRLSPCGLTEATVPSYQSEVCKDAEDYVMVSADISLGRYAGPENESWNLPPLPDINEVSQRFAELASKLGRRLANLVEENVTRDIRRNLLEQIAGNSMDGDPNMRVSEHERIRVSLASVSTASASSTEEAHMRLLESAYLLSNLSVERAAALFSSTSAAMMEMGQHFLSVPPTVWNGFVTRVQTTLRGSADDIGWLVNSPQYPAAEDGTEDFLTALEQIGRGIHILPDTLTYLLVPGLFSNHGALYFFDTKKHFAKLGLPCHIVNIHSELGVEKNAREIKDHIEELYKSTGRKVVLLGHSKGGVDAAAACSMFWPQLKDKVVGIILVQSPYGGSPIASDILREGQIMDAETRRIMEILICRIFKGDILSLEDLTYEKRKEFLAKYSLPADVPVISFHTEASRTSRAVSVMSHIAHAQLPWLPGMARGRTNENSNDNAGRGKLHVAVPLAAAMAICALHLELRYKEKSDGLVTRKDAEVPGSIVVKPEKKLDHAWMVYAPSRREPDEPDAAQMCEALIALLLHHPRWRRGNVPATPDAHAALQEADEASASCATMAQNQDPNEILTTDAARSFLADTEEISHEGLGESTGLAAYSNSGSESCALKFLSTSESREEDKYLKAQDSDVDRLTAEAARTGLCEVAHEGTSRMEGVESLQLQLQISDMVVLESIGLSLREDLIDNYGALSDKSKERDTGTAPRQVTKDVLLPTESSDVKDKMVDASAPTIDGTQ